MSSSFSSRSKAIADQPASAGAVAGLDVAAQAVVSAHDVLKALPEAVYMTDQAGRIIFFNEAAAALWGQRPEIGKTEFCGSWKIFWPSGQPIALAECPMAIALREGRPNRDHDIVVERPDGSRVSALTFPTPLFDIHGHMIGAVNMLVDVSHRSIAFEEAQRFAAIVESSDDAIVAKDLNGTIVSWNRGAEKLFGYTAPEIIGKPIETLIPLDRHDEEPNILARIRAGEQIDHYETLRRRKDGSLVEISLSVSPIRNRQGIVVGASKIARDITERRRAEEQQHMLIREMDHRVKNLFTLANSVVTLSARSATTAAELVSDVSSRLQALAQAHALTIAGASASATRIEQETTLHTLIRTIIAPYDGRVENQLTRANLSGPDVTISGGVVTSFALLLHEFAANAAKYGSLSTLDGRVDINGTHDGQMFVLTWSESGGPPVTRNRDGDGFGTLLGRATVRSQLGGEISREWRPEGLVIRLTVLLARLAGQH
ncbi:PAS domain S-box protein [Ensifer canadensis]